MRRILAGLLLLGLLFGSLLGLPALAAYNPAAVSVPPGLQGNGAGFPLANYVDPTWPKYGAKGDDTTDDTAALTAALVDAKANGYDLFGGGKTYKITATLTVDACHTGLRSLHLDAKTITSGDALAITTSCTDPNVMPVAHAMHANIGLWMDCADGSSSTVKCIHLVGATVAGKPWIPNVILSHGGVVGGQYAVYMAGGGFDIDLDDFPLTFSSDGRHWLYGIYVDAGTNNGERVVIRNSQLNGGATGGCALTNNMFGDVYLTNSSADGSACLVQAIGGGSVVHVIGSHLEATTTDSDYMLIAATVNDAVYVDNSYFSLDVARSHAIGNAASGSTTPNTGGIFLANDYLNFGGHAYAFDALIAGLGRCAVSNINFETFDSKVVGCGIDNFLADAFFGGSTNDWTVSGTGGTLTRITGGGGPEGASTYGQMSNATGAVNITSAKFNCLGGQIPAFSFWYEANNFAASGTSLSWSVNFFDPAGHNLGGSPGGPISTNQASWVLTRTNGATPSPTGTQACQAVLSMTAPSSGSATFNVGALFFQVQ